MSYIESEIDKRNFAWFTSDIEAKSLVQIELTRAYDVLYKNLLKESFELTDDELKAYIFGYTENHLNRVLSKFNLDMMNEFSSID